MSEAELHHWLTLVVFGFAALVFGLLFFITAPYGRHVRKGWGPQMSARLGWIVFESPPVLVFAWIFFGYGDHRLELVPLCLLAVWQFHYIHRAYVFPFRMRSSGKRVPILIVSIAVVFNCLNAYINARWISHLGSYPESWLTDPRFAVGLAIFALGWTINIHADTVLLRLRRPGESGYKIPRGGLYELITCPNYLGEIIAWCGWAVMTWSLPGVAFAVYTVANLVPRAVSNHRWYRETFPDYPRSRRAVIPFIL